MLRPVSAVAEIPMVSGHHPPVLPDFRPAAGGTRGSDRRPTESWDRRRLLDWVERERSERGSCGYRVAGCPARRTATLAPWSRPRDHVHGRSLHRRPRYQDFRYMPRPV